MANSRFYQFLYSKVPMLTMLEGHLDVGSSGAVEATSGGKGITSITKLATGIYQIKLQENFNHFVGADFTFESPVTGGSVSDGSFSVGALYQITAVGTTDWTSSGLPAGLTAAVGQTFVASATGGAGTGTAKAIGKGNIMKVEVAGMAADTMLLPQPIGGVINIQTFDKTEALADPTALSSIRFALFFRNSSVTA